MSVIGMARCPLCGPVVGQIEEHRADTVSGKLGIRKKDGRLGYKVGVYLISYINYF